jgi:hypothetical protein
MEMKPRKTFKRLMDEVGGQLHSRSASDEPRNIQQIYNVSLLSLVNLMILPVL